MSCRFDEIVAKLRQFLKQAGFKESDVTFVPVSGLQGENLVSAAKQPALTAWYKGPSLLQVTGICISLCGCSVLLFVLFRL